MNNIFDPRLINGRYRIPKEHWDIMATEWQSVLLGLGIPLADLDLANTNHERFLQAINQCALSKRFFTASGTNDYTLTPSAYNGYDVTPVDFTKPLVCEFVIPNTNAGTCTIVIAGSSLVAKPLVDISGSALIAGKLIAGDFIIAMWNPTLDKWQIVYSLLGTKMALPQGYKNGFNLSNNAISPNTGIDIAPGAARATGNNLDLETTSTFTKQINSTFIAGSNQGGRASAVSLTNSTWYYVFAISNGIATDFYFDSNIDAINKPAGYTYYRYIGAIYYDVGAIERFVMFGNKVKWINPVNQIQNTAINNNNAQTYTVLVPSHGSPCLADLNVLHTSANSGVYVLHPSVPSPTGQPAVLGITNLCATVVGQSNDNPDWAGNQVSVLTNGSGQIKVVRSTNNNGNISIATFGYEDLLL